MQRSDSVCVSLTICEKEIWNTVGVTHRLANICLLHVDGHAVEGILAIYWKGYPVNLSYSTKVPRTCSLYSFR